MPFSILVQISVDSRRGERKMERHRESKLHVVLVTMILLTVIASLISNWCASKALAETSSWGIEVVDSTGDVG